MARMIFPNIAVKDLAASKAFFAQLGFEFNPQFTDETAACMVVNDMASVMLLTDNRFRDFTKKPLVDPAEQTEAILCFSVDSRDEVDVVVHKAIAAGGKPSNDVMDMGPMYGWSFQDLDGHLWEVMYMDSAALRP